MEWYIFFFISLFVFIGSVVWAICLSRLKYKSGRIINAPKALLIGIVLTAFLLFFPIYYNEFADSDFRITEILLFSLYNIVRLFTINCDFSLITDNIVFLDRWLKTGYTVLTLVLFVAAPLMTFGFVLSFFKNLSSYIKYILKFHSEIYIFSNLSERSLSLAQSLISNNKKRTIVFAGVYKDDDKINDELLDGAYEIGAICFKKEITSINFDIFHRKQKKISFFLCSDNDSDNIEQSLLLASDYKDRENTSLYVFSKSLECELIINNTDTGCIKVRRIDEVSSLIYRTLYDRGYEIFKNAYETNDGSKKINAVIIGVGRYGTEMLKSLSWFCQMDGYTVEINAFDKEKNAEKVFKSLCPELMDERHNGNFSVEDDAKYKINFYSGADVNSSDFDNSILSLNNITYVFVSLGDDELNISVSVKLRTMLRRAGVNPQIQSVVYSSQKKKALDGVRNSKKQPYDIEFIGDMETSFSESVILSSDIESAALARHKKWGEEDTFRKYEYNYRSSVASVIHKKMKIACGIPGADKAVEQRNDEEKMRIRVLEHNRWNAYMRSAGYCYSPVRDELAKTHPNLVPFNELPEEIKKNDDD